MTIAQAIALVDGIKPNDYSKTQKVRWLSNLDGAIWCELIAGRQCSQTEAFEGYAEAGQDTELLVPYPYAEEIYNSYIQAQIDRENGETAKYNQSISLFNSAYMSYANFYNREHPPQSSGRRFHF